MPLAAPIGLSPLLILTLCGSERVLVVSTEPLDDLSCLTTPGVGRPGDGAVARGVDDVGGGGGVWGVSGVGATGRGGGGGLVRAYFGEAKFGEGEILVQNLKYRGTMWYKLSE